MDSRESNESLAWIEYEPEGFDGQHGLTLFRRWYAEAVAQRAAREAAERIANDPEPDLNGPPHTHDPHGVPWRERALVRGNVLRYIAFATTGDENGDAQLGVDNLKAALAAAERELGYVVRVIRGADCCPTANNEGDAGEATYICIGEDGDPIIEADRPADVVLGILRCWRSTQERAERAEAALAASTEREAGLLRAIQPFLHPDLCETLSGNTMGDDSPVFGRNNAVLTLGDFRRLASLAAPEGGTTDGK